MTKKKSDKHEPIYANLQRGILFYMLIIILGEAAAFIVLMSGAHFMFHAKEAQLNAGYVLGFIFPAVVILIVLNSIVLRIAYGLFIPFIKGLKMIANGDFTVRMPEKKRNLLESMTIVRPLYDDFNKMAAELQNTSIFRNDFINNYSHEFKTPVAAINGFANLMLRQNVQEDERRQYLQIIADESKRLAYLSEETLLSFRFDAQQIITEKKLYSLDEQLRQCVIMLSGEWNKKKLNITGDFSEVMYFGNEELMQHLWLNLLNNSIKFTPEKGEIMISLVRHKKEAVVTVSDTGAGMDAETVSHIFEKYYQGYAGKKQEGLGLGLSIVKRIVEICNGTISVKSIPEEGSTFTVKLPLECM